MCDEGATSAPKLDDDCKNAPPFDNGGAFSGKIIHFVSNFKEIRIHFRQDMRLPKILCPVRFGRTHQSAPKPLKAARKYPWGADW